MTPKVNGLVVRINPETTAEPEQEALHIAVPDQAELAH